MQGRPSRPRRQARSSVTAPYIDIAGSLNAPSGTITVKSRSRGIRWDPHAGIVCLDFRRGLRSARHCCPGEGPARRRPPPSRRHGQPDGRHHPLSRSRRAGERRRVSAGAANSRRERRDPLFIATRRRTRHHHPFRAGDRRPVRGAGQSPEVGRLCSRGCRGGPFQ